MCCAGCVTLVRGLQFQGARRDAVDSANIRSGRHWAHLELHSRRGCSCSRGDGESWTGRHASQLVSGCASSADDAQVTVIDARLPWTFVRAPSVCVMFDSIGKGRCTTAVQSSLSKAGFPVEVKGTKLKAFPEAMSQGINLKKLALKSYKLAHPVTKKAGAQDCHCAATDV